MRASQPFKIPGELGPFKIVFVLIVYLCLHKQKRKIRISQQGILYVDGFCVTRLVVLLYCPKLCCKSSLERSLTLNIAILELL